LLLPAQQIAMTTRSDEPAPNEQRERVEEAKLDALKQAASQGWVDLTAGRYVDVEDDQLEAFIGQLGRTDSAGQG
jgi:antitoxin ParD1/3/4